MNEQEALTFLKDVNMDAPFWHQIHDADCKTINVNGKDLKIPIYNLVICTGQMRMYQHGVKPNRHWKVSSVKNYFGLKGNKAYVLQKLETIKSEFTGT
jgi:hypothetical protein